MNPLIADIYIIHGKPPSMTAMQCKARHVHRMKVVHLFFVKPFIHLLQIMNMPTPTYK
jgi:hypothetical protein